MVLPFRAQIARLGDGIRCAHSRSSGSYHSGKQNDRAAPVQHPGFLSTPEQADTSTHDTSSLMGTAALGTCSATPSCFGESGRTGSATGDCPLAKLRENSK
jgi:hypothetical protein